MKIEILEERENPLLNRKEVRFRVEYKGKTPAFGEMRNEFIKSVNSDKKLTIVDSVNSEFGSQSVLGYAKVYKDEESMNVEPEYRVKKNLEGKKAKEKPAEEKAGEEKPTEKPVEAEEKAEKPAEAKPDGKAEEPKPKAEPKARESKPEDKPKEEKPTGTKAEEKAEKPAEVTDKPEDKKDG